MVRQGASICAILAMACGARVQETPATLQGAWVATSAERNGTPAEDVVGNQLTFTVDNRFEIRSKGGTRLFAGTFRVDASRVPASIDFAHREGTLSDRTWLGIYALEDDTLRICDNAPDLDAPRPSSFETPSGSGYVSVTFRREGP